MSSDRAALGAFLRSRRARLTPAQAGIPPLAGPRRVPGLRREELAVLAGLSPDYYSRVEQGRQANISRSVLDALARALRLDDVERAHLHDLAAPARSVSGAQRPDPGLLRVMAMLDHVPVLLLGARSVVLARNPLLTAVLGHPMPPGTVFVRYLLLDPAARTRIVNWQQFAESSVAALRREAARRPSDPLLGTLIAALRAADPQVARWWDDHEVRDYTSMEKLIDHPAAGRLRFAIENLTGLHDPDQRLIVYTVTPDSPTANSLPGLSA